MNGVIQDLDQISELKNEDKILLLCARTHLNKEIRSKLKQLLHQNIDWNYLIQISYEHMVTPLLYRNLNSMNHDSVPEEVIIRLKKVFEENIINNLQLLWELLKILELFKTNNITAIPYKGPLLAISAYGNLGLRQFNDLDIFIHKKDILKAKKLLISQEFVPQLKLTKKQDYLHLKFQREFKFIKDSKEIAVEIQWKFSGMISSFRKDPYLIFTEDRLKTNKINNNEVLSFSNEDLLLILVIHSAGHLWSRLSWIIDISELIQTDKNLKWNVIIDNANELGIERILFISLFIIRDLLKIEIPKNILNKMYSDKYARSKSIYIEKNLMDSSDSITNIKTSILHIKLRENLYYGIKDSISFIMSPTLEEWKIISLPIQISFFYYIIRILRLLKIIGSGRF